MVAVVGELREEVEATEPDVERISHELGDVLLATAFLGHYLDLDPERVARQALRRFEERFRAMEQVLEGSLRDVTYEERLAAWNEAKLKTAR